MIDRSGWHVAGFGESNGLGIDHLDPAMLLGRSLSDEVRPLVRSMLEVRSAPMERCREAR
jgi:hypothetical protein